jgi:hypothetical protein
MNRKETKQRHVTYLLWQNAADSIHQVSIIFSKIVAQGYTGVLNKYVIVEDKSKKEFFFFS